MKKADNRRQKEGEDGGHQCPMAANWKKSAEKSGKGRKRAEKSGKGQKRVEMANKEERRQIKKLITESRKGGR